MILAGLRLHSTQKGGVAGAAPGTSLGTLTGETDPVTGEIYTYTASDLILSPDTEYYVVLTATTPVASGAYSWSMEDSAPSTVNGGWSTSDYLISTSGGPVWEPTEATPEYALTATPVPEPSVLYLALTAGLFGVWLKNKPKGV